MLLSDLAAKCPGVDVGRRTYTSPDSKFRSLDQFELEDMILMAQATTPRFTGQAREKTLTVQHGQIVERFGREDPAADAAWEDHHPIARAIWEGRGLKPSGK